MNFLSRIWRRFRPPKPPRTMGLPDVMSAAEGWVRAGKRPKTLFVGTLAAVQLTRDLMPNHMASTEHMLEFRRWSHAMVAGDGEAVLATAAGDVRVYADADHPPHGFTLSEYDLRVQ